MAKAHILVAPTTYGGEAFRNAKGHAECVTFIQDALHAPSTMLWAPGPLIERLKPGEKDPVAFGTAVATFVYGKYPENDTGHPAVCMGQNQLGIQVMDQWDTKGKVTERTIYWTHAGISDLVDNPYAYSVINW